MRGRRSRSPSGFCGTAPTACWSTAARTRPSCGRSRAIRALALNLDGDGNGGDIVVALGEAALSDDPPAHELPDYVEKYLPLIERNGWTPESFAADYSVPIRVTLRRVRGH